MALTREQEDIINAIYYRPHKFGHILGFDKLTELHSDWIREMIFGKNDGTLQAHRGSYKTTCLSIAFPLIMLLYPNDKILFNRKTDTDVQEIIKQTKKIILSEQYQAIAHKLHGIDEVVLTTDRATEIVTNLAGNDPRGTPQLLGMGTKGSITGKHFDRIFTDDIINKEDRASKAEREKTKAFYQELQNVKNRGGRIFNTGTPWHKDDAFNIMPKPKVYDCYTTGLIDDETLKKLKESMEASLFSANYEMKHIASEDIIFKDPRTNYPRELAEQGKAHIDASYGGSDFTAFTIVKKRDNKYYVFGKLYSKHIDDVEDEIIELRKLFNASRISCETNADKGYLKKELKSKGERVHSYHEDTNKFIKITSYLKCVWKDVYFVEGTDKEYIEQILEYNENAEHDDAPDSLASLIREDFTKEERDTIEDGKGYLLFM